MQKRKITIEIPIPQSVADAKDWISYRFRKLKLQINPYRCSCCGKGLFVKNPEYEYHPEGRHRLLVYNQIWKEQICRECLVNELESKEWTPRFSQMHKAKGRSPRREYQFWSSKKCAVTGSAVRSYKDVEIYPYVDMTFCTIAWNYDRVCKQAVIDAVKFGRIKTSRWGVWNKQKMMPINECGLFIDEQGNLL